MSKLKKFAEAQNKPIRTADEAAYNLYNDMPDGIGAPDEGRQVARPRDINHIYPDAHQPRRAMPSPVREAWNGEPQTVYKQAIVKWVQLVEEERGSRFDVDTFLFPNSEKENADEIQAVPVAGPLEESLMKVLDLASAIQRDGLINPITVVYHGVDHYLLETGERRWLAYHILHHHSYQPEQWQRIPAREVDAFNVWRQASENNARDNLNAIGKARQIAILLMDLHAQQGLAEYHFKRFDEVKTEQEYYVQSMELGTPYGKGRQLLNALGFQNMSTLARHKALLSLSEEAWLLADDYDCPEGVLREVIKLDAAEQAQAILQWHRQKFANGKASGEKPFDSKTFSPKTADQNGVDPLWKSRLDKTFSPQKWQKMPAAERREAYDYLKALLLQLETLGIE